MTELMVSEQNDHNNNNTAKDNEVDSSDHNGPKQYKIKLVWRMIIPALIIHLSAIYGFYIAMFYVKPMTIVFMLALVFMTSFGIQCGAHRLWCHRAYKAKMPLQLMLAFMHILSLQNDIYEWCRDHRAHHKYSETDADPHNANRGFFFAHVGWLLCRKHPDVKEKGKSVDMSDLEKDPLVKFQQRFYLPLAALIWGLFPTYTAYYFWGESLWNSFFTCVMLRYAFTLNLTWFVNSAAHLWGNNKPYDKSINPVECSIRHIMFGEGFHNYHHVFQWDYSASELGPMDVYNPATAFIDVMARIGWAYDLKKASPDMIKARMQRTGEPQWVRSSRAFEFITGGLTLFMFGLPFIVGYFLRDSTNKLLA